MVWCDVIDPRLLRVPYRLPLYNRKHHHHHHRLHHDNDNHRPRLYPLLPSNPAVVKNDVGSHFVSVQLHTYVAKAAPTTGLRGEPKERLEGLLRAAFASTEEEILKETAGEEGPEVTTTTTAGGGDEETEKEINTDNGEEDNGGDDGSSVSDSVRVRQQQDGTTVTACLLVGDLLVCSNVGDTTAVLGSVG